MYEKRKIVSLAISVKINRSNLKYNDNVPNTAHLSRILFRHPIVFQLLNNDYNETVQNFVLFYEFMKDGERLNFLHPRGLIKLCRSWEQYLWKVFSEIGENGLFNLQRN